MRDWNINKKEELKNELRREFPNVSDEEINTINGAYDQLVDRLVAKSHRERNVVERIVEEKIEYINSKHII